MITSHVWISLIGCDMLHCMFIEKTKKTPRINQKKIPENINSPHSKLMAEVIHRKPWIGIRNWSAATSNLDVDVGFVDVDNVLYRCWMHSWWGPSIQLWLEPERIPLSCSNLGASRRCPREYARDLILCDWNRNSMMIDTRLKGRIERMESSYLIRSTDGLWSIEVDSSVGSASQVNLIRLTCQVIVVSAPRAVSDDF